MNITGTDFNDILIGTPGADLISGQGGSDWIRGAGGGDTLDGGEGTDTADYSKAPGAVRVDLAQGGALDGQGGTDTLVSIEQVQGSAFSDLLIGTDGAGESLAGGIGQDTLHGGRGDDSLDGGVHDGDAGWDWVSYLFASAAVNVNLATGVATGAQGNDALANLEAVMGTAFADTLTGDAQDNILRGNGGNDIVEGGAGDDWVDYAAAPGAVAVSLVTGTATGADGSDTLTGIERIAGSQFDDLLTGNAEDNRLQGNGGDDTLVGGAGNDGADYKDAGGAVFVRLAQGIAGGADGNDVLAGIENIHGSANFGDDLRGDDGANIIEGRGGNDVIDGAQGLDVAVFSGRFAQYRILVEVGNFDLVVIGPDGIDRLNNVEVLKFDDRIFVVRQGGDIAERLDGTSAGDLLRGRNGNDEVLGGDGDDAVYGDEGTDTLDGGTGDDWLDGGTGADTMTGGVGNDTYVVDSLDDAVQEPESSLALAMQLASGPGALDIGGSIDTVIASITYTLGTLVENLTLAEAAGDLAGTGNALDNELTGNEGDNVLEGGAGNDSIVGGEGIDTAAYAGPRGEYLLSVDEEGVFTIQGPADGTDTLDVERLRFADIGVALDLEGNAGTVAKILGAVFGAASVGNREYAGIGIDYADGGMTYESLMQLALDARLGAGAAHADVVTLLYTNVVGVAPDEASLALYTGLLDDGSYTQASLGVLAAETTFNTDNIDLTGLAETGIEFL